MFYLHGEASQNLHYIINIKRNGFCVIKPPLTSPLATASCTKFDQCEMSLALKRVGF